MKNEIEGWVMTVCKEQGGGDSPPLLDAIQLA